MGTRRRQRTADEWKSWVERWKASGLGGKTFAEQHGLTFSSLYRWARVLEGKARPKVGSTEVKVHESSESTAPKVGTIEIVTRTGWVVRVTGAVDVVCVPSSKGPSGARLARETSSSSPTAGRSV